MPTRRAISQLAANQARGQFAAPIRDAQIAIGDTRGNLAETRANLAQLFAGAAQRYKDQPDTRDLDATMNLMNNSKLAFAGTQAAQSQDRRLSQFADLYKEEASNRANDLTRLKQLRGFREQDLTRENENYYRKEGNERRQALSNLYSQRGASQMQLENQMTREQWQRDFQSAESRRARAFQAQQNALSRNQQSTQAQRQYDLALQQLGLSKSQFREGRRQFNVNALLQSQEKPLTLGESNYATQIARTWLPIWWRDNVKQKGGQFYGKKRTGSALKYLEDQGLRGAQFYSGNYKDVLPGRFKYDTDKQTTDWTRYKWSPRELAEAYRQFMAAQR